MTAIRKRVIVGLVVVALVAISGAAATAQCTTCATGTVAYYQPVAYQTYSPVAYTTYRPYTGWYPGYWIGRANNAVWGRPLWPAYHAWYRRSYAVGYTPTTATYYEPTTSCYEPAATCSSCTSYYSPCSTCSTVSQVVMRPVCSTSCATTCDPCSSCATGVSQATYAVPSGCSPCAVSQAVPSAGSIEGGQQQPTLSPAEEPPAERTFRREPTGNGLETPPADYDNDNNASYFEAPKLFNPKDRTARRSATPVHSAIYHKPIAASQASAESASWHQYDAEGWVSASQ